VTTILGMAISFIASHLGGSVIGGVLSRFGVLGFGRKIGIAKHILAVGIALRNAYTKEPNEARRNELKRWLKANDPQNESKLGDGIV